MFTFNDIKYPHVKDLTGKIFGYLTVVNFIKIDEKWHGAIWKCLCKCGNIKIYTSKNLLRGNATSCGCKIKNQLEQGESGFNSLFRKYKAGAISRDLSFFLDKEYFRKLVISICFYCGAEPAQKSTNNSGKRCTEYGRNHSIFIYNGIDRLDNNLGYTKENCVTCCKICNLAKHSMSLNGFTAWVFRVCKNLESKGKIYE